MSYSRRHLFAQALAWSVSNPLSLIAASKLDFPFTLGVASGEPTPDGIVLWTRLLPKEPLPEANIEVRWEIAEDEGFAKIVRRGREVATPMLAHAVHAEVGGLKPGRWYHYRFLAGGHRSPAGRFKTAPARGDGSTPLNFAFASCQQWTQGLWTAYEHMCEENLDLVIHLGDYIYEQGYKGTVRPDGHEETFTLADYRNRHALYKSDPLLQKAHACFPWCVTWDDHEVSNNYADDIQEKGQPRTEFLERRASAYQAYYEHMPLRKAQMHEGSKLRLHRRLEFGQMVRLHMLDTRQHRTDQPCGDGSKPVCAEMNRPDQTLLGAEQEKWLEAGLRESGAVWDVLGQQILVTFQDFDPGPGETVNMDSWSGYPLARGRLIAALEAAKSNAVILTGDVHASWVGQLHREAQNVNSPCVAAEFVGTSISSGGDGSETTERGENVLRTNPQIRYFNARRGYVRCQASEKHFRADYRLLEYVTRPGSPVATRVAWAVEPGRLVPERA
jgi:alkaline phosphatase D